METEQRDLCDLRLIRDVLDGQEVAEVAARALGEVLQRPVGATLDDELKADGRCAPLGRVSRDEPDVSTGGESCEDIYGTREDGSGGRGMLTFHRTGS